MRTLVVLDHHKDVSEGKKENIEEMNSSFISIKANLDILKKKKGKEKKLSRNIVKSTDILNSNFLKYSGTNLKYFETYKLFF